MGQRLGIGRRARIEKNLSPSRGAGEPATFVPQTVCDCAPPGLGSIWDSSFASGLQAGSSG